MNENRILINDFFYYFARRRNNSLDPKDLRNFNDIFLF